MSKGAVFVTIYKINNYNAINEQELTAGFRGDTSMELKSMNCPNCGGPVKQTEDGRFICESCGTPFIPDYDQEDVEFQRIKNEADLRAQQAQKAKERKKVKTITIVSIVVGVVLIMSASVIFTVRMAMTRATVYRAERQQREAEREQKKQQEEEQRKQEEESRKAEEEAERQALLASYKVTPEELLADSFFVENANAALFGQLKNNTNLYYTNWAWNKQPKYKTSYLLIAKDENNRKHNILVNLYKVFWDKEYDGSTERYVMFDGTCLYNVSLNPDGTIKSDYEADGLTYNSEIKANQFLSGYSDYKQLIRQEIYGNSDYDYIEFKMPTS